ncbi:ABC transporter ATP-binding protein [Ilumatobacter sp.]|uniref:ABC transporter ATP-binding protein n=1 Tax=Ilumatobacter sp. TaxID=1967498 RepID=UPI003B525858
MTSGRAGPSDGPSASTAPERGRPAVEMSGIRRSFGTTVALDGIDLVLRDGEIHAVLGANGAGKTTLMRVLAGLERPDAGEVVIDGEAVSEFEPRRARSRGVALVQQHFTLVPTLTAAENLVLARPDGRLRPDRGALRRRLDELVERYGLDVRGDVAASELSVGEQQRLELLRALDADARVLVLDEPTAVLTDREAEHLLGVCRSLADDGRAVAVITHRLGEVFSGCDRVSVLRAGREVLGDVAVADCDRAQLATAMIGSESTGRFAAREPAVPTPSIDGGIRGSVTRGSGPSPDAPPSRRVRLAARGLGAGRVHGLDLDVAAGEIVGIAGIDGNGQSDLEAVLSGRAAPDAGTVTIDGSAIETGDPAARAAAGVAYVPSDRYRHGLVRPMDLSENLELGRTRTVRHPRRRRHREATDRLDDWDVRSAGPGAAASTLSGGNAQKLVLARELGGDPGVVVACYPTRGLDPGAAATVAERLVERARRGSAVLWIGAELDELFAVSDRIVVMSDGAAAGEFHPPFDRDAIGLAMTDDVSPVAST